MTTNLIRKAFRYLFWNCQVLGVDISLLVFWFSPESLNFTIDSKCCSCLPWSNKLTLFLVKKMSGKYPSMNDHSFLVVFAGKNGGSWKKHLLQLATQIIAQVLLKITITLLCNWSALWVISLLRILKRYVLKYKGLIIIIFTASTSAFLSETLPLSPHQGYVVVKSIYC